jgi:hypothetical protein
MDGLILVERARANGLTVIADGDRLTMTGPKTKTNAAIVKELAANKAAVLAWLTIETPIDIAPDITVKVIKYDAQSLVLRPPLPRELWRSGIADYGDAWRIWWELRKDCVAAMGKHESGYYINDSIAEGFIE